MKRQHYSKITRPAVSRVYLRKRLFKVLDEARSSSKALWVCGPPGAGKTTLINSYLDHLDIDTVWYQVDEGDNDIATFFHYLGLAARGNSKSKRSLPHFTPEYLLGLCAFTRRFFQDFFSLVPRPFALVLDNLQEATASRLHEVLRCCLKEAPAGCTIILISRTEPHHFLARECANREMARVGWEELRLREEEARAVAKLMGHQTSVDEMLGQLQGKAEGWIAGLLLMIERAKKGEPLIKDMQKHAVESVFNYFMAEIFEKTGEETREFLLKTAFLPSMTLKMASGLSGNGDAGRILTELNSKHFFTERRCETDPLFQYHPLFREFLLARVKEDFSAVSVRELQRSAAVLLAESGQTDDAARAFIESEDWDGLSALIARNAKDLLMQGRLNLLESWLTSVPADILKRSPWLIYFLGLCRTPFNPTEARLDLGAAYDLFKAQNDPAGLFLSWSGIIDTHVYERNDFDKLDHWIKEFQGLMKKYKQFPSPDIGDRASAAMFSALVYRKPDHPDLPEWEERVKLIMLNSRDSTQKLLIGHNLICYYIWSGNIAKAGLVLDILVPLLKTGAPAMPHLMCLFSKALYGYHASDYVEALKDAEEGLSIAERTGIHLTDVLLTGMAVLSAIALGDLKTAERHLGKVREPAASVNLFDAFYYHHQASMVELGRGNHSLAFEHADTALKLTISMGAPYITNVMLYGITYIRLEVNKTDGIEKDIEDLRSVGRRFHSKFYEYAAFLLESFSALKKGDEAVCLERLQKALVLGREYGLKFFPLFKQSTVSALLTRALEAGLETGYVKELAKINRLTPEAPLEEWPWDVRIYTLGGFEIFKGDRLVEFARKAQQKPLALLKYLIAFGAVNVSQGALTDALWPDSDGDMAQQAFSTTLHRLRKLIGERSVISIEGRLTLNQRCCWVDVARFEMLLKACEARCSSEDCERGEWAINKALALYRGPFLANDKEPWALPVREKLKSMAVRSISKCGGQFEKKEKFEKAAELYLKGLEIDPLAEKLCQRLMLCYKAEGLRNEALRAYNRLKEDLKTHLKAEPSKETRAIYRLIEEQ